jgi:acyl carrier protein
VSETEIREALREWVRERAADRLEGDLRDDTPLLDSGILKSLDVVELVVYLEHLREEEIDVDMLEPGLLKSIDTLYQSFFAHRAG